MADAHLMNLPGLGAAGHLEVIERAVDDATLSVIVGLADAVGASLDVVPGRRRDCAYACSAWRRELERHGVEAIGEGGVGEDEDAFTADRVFIPLDRRSGYREDDGRTHRHWWLRVGPGRWLFDPTAHQFDGRGGIEPGRYTIDGVGLRI